MSRYRYRRSPRLVGIGAGCLNWHGSRVGVSSTQDSETEDEPTAPSLHLRNQLCLAQPPGKPQNIEEVAVNSGRPSVPVLKTAKVFSEVVVRNND